MAFHSFGSFLKRAAVAALGVSLACGLAEAKDIYVSASSTPSKPYGDWKTAANDLATAIAYSADDDVIIVDDGTFTVSAGLSVTKAVTIKSRTGADKTTVYTASAITLFTVNNAKAKLKDLTLSSDYVSRGVKALDLTSGTVDGCTIRDFKSTSSLIVHKGTITNSVITHNYTSGRVNLLSVEGSGARTIDTKIVGNEGNNNTYGCAVYLWNSSVLFRNCLFACNTNNSSAYSAFSNHGSYSATLENCTIADNVVKQSGTTAGVYITDRVTVKNCIIHNNRNVSGVLNIAGDTKYVMYSATDPVPGDATKHNVRSTADIFGSDYSLKMGAWVDSGTSLDWHTGAKDLAGGDRVSGAAVDMGCHEFAQDGSLTCAAVPSVSTVIGEQDIAIGALVVGTNRTGLVYTYVVKDADGKTVYSAENVTASAVTNRFGRGSYEITLSVRNECGETDTWTGKERFTVLPDTVYVSKSSASPAEPYGSWGTAAHDLATALAACSDGMTVIVDDGVYTNDAALAIAKKLTVKSRHDAERTRLFTAKAITLLTLGNADARFEGFTLESDYVQRNVTALDLQSGVFVDCTIRNFKTGLSLIGHNGSGLITNCVITGNYVEGRNNLMSVNGSSTKTVDTKIVGNNGNNDTYGCAIYLWNNSTLFRDCLIACNTNNSTGYSAFSNHGSYSATFENCTIADNVAKASDTSAGLRIGSSCTFKNCVIHNNTNKTGIQNFAGSTDGITYSATEPLIGGEPAHNVLATAAIFGDEYSLKIGKWIDGGTPLVWHAGAKDLAGNDRVQGTAVDMGCYEAVPLPLGCSISLESAVQVGRGDFTLTAVVVGSSEGDIDYVWTVSNQLTHAVVTRAFRNEATFSYDYPYGTYSVRLTVTQGDKSVSDAMSDAFTVYPQTVRVNKMATPAFPYDTTESAFTNISAAIAFAQGGMRVLVADGVYTNTEKMVVARPVTVESEHGAERTAIFSARNETVCRLFDPGCVFRGFTLRSDGILRQARTISVEKGTMADCIITNFNCNYEPVAYVSAVFTNCTIIGCRSSYRTYFTVIDNGGVVSHCRILGNESDGSPYTSLLHTLNGATVRNTLVAGNRVAGVNAENGIALRCDGGAFVNCTIASNVCADAEVRPAICKQGGNSATMRNCIVWGNPSSAGELTFASSQESMTFANCLTADDSVTGTGCLVADPKFVTSADWRRRYRISRSSPAVDAGDWTLFGKTKEEVEAATDLSGAPRLLGREIDMGCYENNASGLLLLVR